MEVATSNAAAQSSTEENLAYPLNYSTANNGTETGKIDPTMTEPDQKKMVLKCKACGNDFQSTFSVREFSMLSQEQYEAGTLHLCPDCGNLSIYKMKDYREPK
jgi:DNA-directed RNA polymerase subunit RPC12/RpoP